MWFEFKVAWRFLKSGKTQSILILLGIIIGVSVQVFLGSLIGGLQQDLINETVGSSPHITILSEEDLPRPLVTGNTENGRIITFSGKEEGISRWQNLTDYLEEYPDITAISPVIDGSGFAVRGQKNVSVFFRGIDLEKADQIYEIRDGTEKGTASVSGNNIMIGTELANELQLTVNDVIKLNISDGISDRFIISGIFDLGSKDINDSWIFMSRQRAEKFLRLRDEVSSIELQIRDVFTSNQIADQIINAYPGITAESWQRNNQSLLTALESQSSSSLVIQVFIIIAVTLGIASVLAVSVVQKSKQIGILKAMGTARKRIGLIFLIEGSILGFFGSILGALTGIGLSQIFVNLVRNSAGDPLFPVTIDPVFISISISIATLAGMIAALIPARNSAKMKPVEVIRGA
ncbi:MAG: ABC transporter permease [Halanaerobiales bacterium]